jgi:hypothetical protein
VRAFRGKYRVDGLGAKGIQEIKKLLAQHGITLKQ